MTVAFLLPCLPAAIANTIPTLNMETTAYLAFRPNPIGKGQELLINAWTVPPPPMDIDMGLAPTAAFGSGIPRINNNIYITKPDGTLIKFENLTSYGDGSLWLTYTPDQVGTYTLWFNWTGVDIKGEPGAQVAEASYLPCSTEKQTLVVQETPIASYPAASLPTDTWTWPVNPENREWADIMGAWFYQRYDATQSNYQPYSQGPESSHILWIKTSGNLAGLVGQPYGYTAANGLEYESESYPSISTVMFGKGYYTANAGSAVLGGGSQPIITCVDIRTGEELWAVPGTCSAGIIEPLTEPMGMKYQPVIFDIGARIVKYDAATGVVLLNETGIPDAMTGQFGSGYINYPYAVIKQHLGSDPYTGYYLVKFWLNGTATDISQRIAWNVTMDSFNNLVVTNDFKLAIYNDIIFNIEYPVYSDTGAFNATTGEILWHHPQDAPYGIEQGAGGATLGNGNAYFAVEDRHYAAYDLKTGAQVWLSEQTDYPWGNFWAYDTANAYGMVYGFGYNGIYAFNASTGTIIWHSTAGDSEMETPYGTWPFWGTSHIVADGKVYAGTCEHGPTVFYRGNGLFCFDAYNGNLVWNISGYFRPSALAEGTLFATNAYDANMYAFTKGETATTISVQNDIYQKGASILIKGTVTDLSPAQPNTPAVSDDSMTAWMEYLHMQQPKPTDTTGVTVKLTATGSNGQSEDIGTVTSDANGNYAFMWTPSSEGTYTITATFEGSKSYYASSAETAVGISASTSGSPSVSTSPAVPATAQPSVTSPTQGPSTNTYIIIAAIVVIVAVVAAAVVLRKQRK
jgi:outer membrane protein assembly factor BamB